MGVQEVKRSIRSAFDGKDTVTVRFSSKPSNLKDLIPIEYRGVWGKTEKVNVEKTFHLRTFEYDEYTSDFFNDFNWAQFCLGDRYSVIRVTAADRPNLIIDSQGFDYPRYVAYEDVEDVEGTKRRERDAADKEMMSPYLEEAASRYNGGNKMAKRNIRSGTNLKNTIKSANELKLQLFDTGAFKLDLSQEKDGSMLCSSVKGACDVGAVLSVASRDGHSFTDLSQGVDLSDSPLLNEYKELLASTASFKQGEDKPITRKLDNWVVSGKELGRELERWGFDNPGQVFQSMQVLGTDLVKGDSYTSPPSASLGFKKPLTSAGKGRLIGSSVSQDSIDWGGHTFYKAPDEESNNYNWTRVGEDVWLDSHENGYYLNVYVISPRNEFDGEGRSTEKFNSTETDVFNFIGGVFVLDRQKRIGGDSYRRPDLIGKAFYGCSSTSTGSDLLFTEYDGAFGSLPDGRVTSSLKSVNSSGSPRMPSSSSPNLSAKHREVYNRLKEAYSNGQSPDLVSFIKDLHWYNVPVSEAKSLVHEWSAQLLKERSASHSVVNSAMKDTPFIGTYEDEDGALYMPDDDPCYDVDEDGNPLSSKNFSVPPDSEVGVALQYILDNNIPHDFERIYEALSNSDLFNAYIPNVGDTVYDIAFLVCDQLGVPLASSVKRRIPIQQDLKGLISMVKNWLQRVHEGLMEQNVFYQNLMRLLKGNGYPGSKANSIYDGLMAGQPVEAVLASVKRVLSSWESMNPKKRHIFDMYIKDCEEHQGDPDEWFYKNRYKVNDDLLRIGLHPDEIGHLEELVRELEDYYVTSSVKRIKSSRYESLSELAWMDNRKMKVFRDWSHSYDSGTGDRDPDEWFHQHARQIKDDLLRVGLSPDEIPDDLMELGAEVVDFYFNTSSSVSPEGSGQPILSAKTKAQAQMIQEYMLSYYDSYEDLLNEAQSLYDSEGFSGLRRMVECGFFACYYDDCRSFLDSLYGTAGDKYSDEVVWDRYCALLAVELNNIIRNPDGGGRNYLKAKTGKASHEPADFPQPVV